MLAVLDLMATNPQVLDCPHQAPPAIRLGTQSRVSRTPTTHRPQNRTALLTSSSLAPSILIPNWTYNLLHGPFARFGETFLVVSPFEIVIVTDSAEAIRQVTQRREQFPKMIETYAILRQFGDNVLTTEGVMWRVHRKVTSASFNERNAALVFAESIRQTESLCDMWLGPDGKGNKTIDTIDHDTMRLALNIIGYVGFGLRLLWPGQSLPATADPKLKKYSSLEAPEGYTMSFTDAVAVMLDKILLLLLVPAWLLRGSCIIARYIPGC